MTKKIAAAALLGALATYCYFLTSTDTPGVDSRHTSRDRAQPALTSESKPPPTGRLHTPGQQPASGAMPDDDTEVVLGIRVRKDRNCRVELNDYVTPDGEMFSAYSCTPYDPAPEHAYEHYDDDTLAAMAYADAEASALLGRRLIGTDTPKAYRLLIRASALDGGSLEHIAWLADQAFGTVAIDGKPQLANLERQYELAALAAQLGDASGKSEQLRNELIRIGAGSDRIEALDARAEELLRSMRDIQQRVLGEVTIGGQGDA